MAQRVPRETPKPPGWRGSDREFTVNSQQCGRTARIGLVDSTAEYPTSDDYDD